MINLSEKLEAKYYLQFATGFGIGASAAQNLTLSRRTTTDKCSDWWGILCLSIIYNR